MGVDVEVDNFFAASVRAQYNVTESFGVFLQPSYGRLAVTARAGNVSVSDDEWEFGLGGGVSFKLSDAVALEAFYESFDESDVVSMALRYHF